VPTDEDRFRVLNYITKQMTYDKKQHMEIDRQWRVLEKSRRRR